MTQTKSILIAILILVILLPWIAIGAEQQDTDETPTVADTSTDASQQSLAELNRQLQNPGLGPGEM